MRLTIGQRILAGFGIIIVLILCAGMYELSTLRAMNEINTQIANDDIRLLDQINDLTQVQSRAWVASERMLSEWALMSLGLSGIDYTGSVQAWRDASTDLGKSFSGMGSSVQELQGENISTDRAALLQELRATLASTDDLLAQIRAEMQVQIDRLAAGDLAAAKASSSKSQQLRLSLAERSAKLKSIVQAFVTEGSARSISAYATARTTLLVTIGVIIVLGSIATWLLRRSITRPLAAFTSFVERIGSGDLSQKTSLRGRDEVAVLGDHLNRMVDGLREMALQTRNAAENLNAATVQIRASTQQQAASVEEQLAAVQETSATLDEITQSGAQMSRRAQDIAEGTDDTLHASSTGLKAVEDTGRSMDLIREQAEAVASNIVMLSEKTQAVGDIIATVNDISERSHILALNAAIEAAAAGENGRSFAVVAAEIKNLADQSKEATVQVRAILGDIQRGISTSVMLTEEAVKRVASGKEQTDKSQQAIDDLTETIGTSTETFQQIVAAINQQHIGLEQVMIALRNIRQASTQTADGTRQLDGAAANLTALASQLSHSVNRYSL